MSTEPKTISKSEELTRLLACADQLSIFRNPDGAPYALLPGDLLNQWDAADLRSPDFDSFLLDDYHDKFGEFPSAIQIGAARRLLDRRIARRPTPTLPVSCRVARGNAERWREPGDPQIYRETLALDLGRPNPGAEDLVLEIDADGWSVNNASSFYFLRHRGYRHIPAPEPAGDEALRELKAILRADDAGFHRILAWLLAAMRPKGPYPILVLQGETGSGKTRAATILRSLLDPAAVPFQCLPANPNQLLAQARQTWIQAYDHVTAMPKEISSTLCRLSAGAAFNLPAGPKESPIAVNLARPILLTVPTDAKGASWRPRPDLLDRTLTATLTALTAQDRRPQSEIEERFEKIRPQILGALAQAASRAMQREKEVRLTACPRNASAAIWAIAAFPQIQPALEERNEFALPKDPLIDKVVTLMAAQPAWQGTATKLALDLDLPVAANHLSRKLKEVTEILQAQGIGIVFPRRGNKGQTIRITKSTSPAILPEPDRHIVTNAAQATTPDPSTSEPVPLSPRQPPPPIDAESGLTIHSEPDRHIVTPQQSKGEILPSPSQLNSPPTAPPDAKSIEPRPLQPATAPDPDSPGDLPALSHGASAQGKVYSFKSGPHRQVAGALWGDLK